MRFPVRRPLRWWLISVAALASGTPAFGCAVCVGDPSSPLTWGANRGIVFLISMVGLVYAGVVAFVIVVRRRSAARAGTGTAALDELRLQARVAAKGVRS